jgi:selenocysteine lyase/cysteine desulfurase
MMQTALDQIIAWGVDNIQDYSKQLVSPYLKAFRDMGFAIEEEAYRSNHLLGLAAPLDFDLENLSSKLKQANIHVSARGSSIRLATSVYNNKRDLDQFYAILHKEYAIT